MAERRMFSKSVTSSDSFLDMSCSARMLYFALGIVADDDGFITGPRGVMRLYGCQEKDMQELINSGFIYRFSSGVVLIRHWKINNLIQKDRYKASTAPEKNMITLNEETRVYELIKSVDTQDGYKVDTQDGYKVEPQYSIGKYSIDKDSIAAAAAKPDILTFYEENIRPVTSQVEAEKICDLESEYGPEWLKEAIKEAALNHAASTKYIAAILARWKTTGAAEPWKEKTPQVKKQQTAAEMADEVMQILDSGGVL